ncbi:hypothetical protein ACIRRH_16655 [Kitasatospora sp. NPDC101235]|uniref:hypothetical protein n=1 Tax=Kitasatospora sp. NPDC101235 TaxID=3364101 RepID=UPI0038152AEE
MTAEHRSGRGRRTDDHVRRLARLEPRIREGDAKAALDEFEALVAELGQGSDASDLWVRLLENLREEYEDLDED